MSSESARSLALVFSDLVDSTALKSRIGDAAMDVLLVRHRDHVARLATDCGGQIIDWAGDGCFLTFETSSASVRFALGLQQIHADETDLPTVRIGIHLGEVTEREGRDGLTDVKGLAVDVAARVSSLAGAGQILMTSLVYDSARQRIEVDSFDQPMLWKFHGLYAVKGFDRPLEIGEVGLEGWGPLVAPKAGEKVQPVRSHRSSRTAPDETHPGAFSFRFVAKALVGSVVAVLVLALVMLLSRGERGATEAKQPPAASGQTPSAAPIAPEKSIAVLPFVNMSSDPEQEYFSDGLSEEILNLLARASGLAVTARTSSFAFKGKNEDVRTIGETLSVGAVLEGSVRKSGEQVRITAQLIDVTTGTHIWSETYDRTLTDIFAVQESVAAEILDALLVHVGEAPTRGRPTENPEAYSLALRAKAALNDYDGKGAEAFLHRAIELDPEFAEAHELLALSYSHQGGEAIDPGEAQRLTHDAAAKALAINPGLLFARALWESGKVEGYSFYKEIRALERVVSEDPSHGEATDALIYSLMASGYFEEALGIAERFASLDPLSGLAHAGLSEALKSTGRRTQALASLKIAEQLGFSPATWELGNLNLEAKHDEIAITYFESALRNRNLPTEWVRRLVVRGRDPATGQAHVDHLLSQLEVPFPFEYSQGYSRFYLALGFLDRFFDVIFELGVSDPGWSSAENLSYWGTIDRRSGFTAHPRYLELAERFGLTELWDQRGAPDHCKKLDGQWVCK